MCLVCRTDMLMEADPYYDNIVWAVISLGRTSNAFGRDNQTWGPENYSGGVWELSMGSVKVRLQLFSREADKTLIGILETQLVCL
jgi:hypothetical protein